MHIKGVSMCHALRLRGQCKTKRSDSQQTQEPALRKYTLIALGRGREPSPASPSDLQTLWMRGGGAKPWQALCTWWMNKLKCQQKKIYIYYANGLLLEKKKKKTLAFTTWNGQFLKFFFLFFPWTASLIVVLKSYRDYRKPPSPSLVQTFFFFSLKMLRVQKMLPQKKRWTIFVF